MRRAFAIPRDVDRYDVNGSLSEDFRNANSCRGGATGCLGHRLSGPGVVPNWRLQPIGDGTRVGWNQCVLVSLEEARWLHFFVVNSLEGQTRGMGSSVLIMCGQGENRLKQAAQVGIFG